MNGRMASRLAERSGSLIVPASANSPIPNDSRHGIAAPSLTGTPFEFQVLASDVVHRFFEPLPYRSRKFVLSGRVTKAAVVTSM
jgi:hypothetical protein